MRFLVPLVLLNCLLRPGLAVEKVTLRRVPEGVTNSGEPTKPGKQTGPQTEQETLTLEGELLVEDAQGGCLLLTADGQLHPCGVSRIVSRESNDDPLQPQSTDEVGKGLLQEFGAGFSLYRTEHYVVVHNTNETYVRWCAGLFERLHRAFYVFWKTRDHELQPARFPLVAVVFNSREAFEKYAKPEVGEGVASVIGYYNLQTNRMTTYAMPNPERNVATVIHEAAHQLAYNSGLQTRMADNPLWVSEGLAIYFESPDLSTSRGWRTVGKTNEVNLARFRRYLPNRPADSLQSLIIDDRRFVGLEAEAAYGESWALNYFLLKTRGKNYVKYLQMLAQGKPLESTDPQRRLNAFTAEFGDLKTLDSEFLKFMQRVH